ncbi:MmgE/PrpD family protein [Chloroflexota bacterium]
MGLTEKVAAFVVDTHFDKIPKDTSNLAKRAFLDCLGVSLIGSGEPVSKILQEFLQETGGTPTASVIGTKVRTSSPWAALANGTIAHAIDYDDAAGLPLPFHPSVPVLPVVLALGEQIGASGKQVLEAYIVGLEVETKIGSIMGMKLTREGWHATGIVGTLGATAAGTKILQLDQENTRTAFGLAASLVGGLSLNFGTMTKPFHAGQAACNGVTSSILAGKGFTANKSILEETGGFLDIFTGTKDYDPDKVIGSLGEPYYLVSPGITIKKYPSCHGTHTALDAIFDLMKEHGFSYQDVAVVECGVRPHVLKGLIYEKPTNHLEAKFSMQYCLAAALFYGRVGLEQFDNEKINRPEVREIMGKVNMYARPDLESQPPTSILVVKLRDGREFLRRVDWPRGGPGTPLSWEEIAAKFKNCAGSVLPSNKIDSLVQMIESMEEIKDIRALVELVT